MVTPTKRTKLREAALGLAPSAKRRLPVVINRQAVSLSSRAVKRCAVSSYVAAYAGDAAWKSDTSDPVAVTVAARWKGKAIGGYATAGGYRLYHYSSSCQGGTSTVCPAAVFTLSPNHAGQRVSYYGRYCKAGRCITDHGRYRLNKKSQTAVHIFYGSSQVIGFALYLRFTFSGDSDHARSTSKVIKEKITA